MGIKFPLEMSSDDLFETGEIDLGDEEFFDKSIFHGNEYSTLYEKNQTHDKVRVYTTNSLSTNFAFYFKNLNKHDMGILIDEIILNKNVPDASLVIFEMFRKFMEECIYLNNFTKEDIKNLDFISQAIIKLSNSKKLNENGLSALLLDRYLTLPFELIWWLHKFQIIYFEQYWDLRKPEDVPEQMLTILQNNSDDYPFRKDAILQDILVELLSGCYGPRIGICRLYKSKLWSSYCSDVLNEFTEKALASVFENKKKPFANFLPLIRESELLPSNIKNRFYCSIIQKFLNFKLDEYDMDSAFLYQHLWTTESCPASLLTIYEEMFCKYCDFTDIMRIFNKSGYNDVNWKFLLYSVAASVRFSKRSRKQLQETVQENLNLMFKGGKITHYKIAILFIRQATFEDAMELKYENWYSDMFGLNSAFKTAENQTMFRFFMSCLNKTVMLEPKYFLKIHLRRSIRAPPKCNTSVLDYKNSIRARLLELQRHPRMTTDNSEINVLQMIENSFRLEAMDPILLKIIREKYQEFYEKVVPHLLKNKNPFSRVKNLLIDKKIVTAEVLDRCKVAEDVEIIISDDDDDDDLVLKNK